MIETADKQTIQYCEVGPGWKPPPEMMKNATSGREQANPFAARWTAVPFRQLSSVPEMESSAQGRRAATTADVASLSVDLAALKGRRPLAIRLAWPIFPTRVGTNDDMCCVHSAAQKDSSKCPGGCGGGPVGGLAPCVPGNCPLYSSVSELPANPFFAKIVGGKCECEAPQTCGATTSVAV